MEDDICHVTFRYLISRWVSSCFTDDSVAANDRYHSNNYSLTQLLL